MFKFNNDINFNSFTVIIPSVSVGNVGQFAADLLITSLEMKKIGMIWDPTIVPVIGGDPYDVSSQNLMTSCELYANVDSKISVLQIRSPLSGKDTKELLQKVGEFFIKYQLKNIIILSSSFAAEKHTINSVEYRYFANNLVNTENIKSTNWIDYNMEREGNTVIHGGGFAKKLFDICTENKLPCLVLFKYCSEGDNIPDAIDMVTYLNKWLNLLKEVEGKINYEIPPSWNLLFGSPPPKDLY